VLHGVTWVTRVQDSAFSLVESHTAGIRPSIHTVQIPLQSLPNLNQIDNPALFVVIYKLSVHSITSSKTLIKILTRTGPIQLSSNMVAANNLNNP